MRLRPHTVEAVRVEERSQVAFVRRRAQALARRQGFDEATEGKLALTVSEAAGNLLDHAQGGEVVVTASDFGEARWIDVLTIDQGPGIRHLGRALAGGVSTAGGLGQGLGAIRRLADSFEIFAPSEQGTVIAFRFYSQLSRPPEDLPQLGAVCRPKRRQPACGDAWTACKVGRTGAYMLLVVDGVGHGEAACEAATKAVETLDSGPCTSPSEVLRNVHRALEHTRGAAGAAVLLDPRAGRLSFCGIGNLQATLINLEGRRGLASLNGILGQGRVELQEFHRDWPEGTLLVVHTDGVSSRWILGDYPGLRIRHPALVSGVLYRDFSYDHDDSTVLVARR